MSKPALKYKVKNKEIFGDRGYGGVTFRPELTCDVK
jgi:hypothetical protein